MTHTNHNPDGAFQRIAAKVVFGNRPLVLLLFALMTLVMGFYASQLRVDAGFKKQIPLQHEYMKTFLEYEREFGGANRVLVALEATDGNMFDQEFFATLEKITQDVVDRKSTRLNSSH